MTYYAPYLSLNRARPVDNLIRIYDAQGALVETLTVEEFRASRGRPDNKRTAVELLFAGPRRDLEPEAPDVPGVLSAADDLGDRRWAREEDAGGA
jgi:hypothetical protein